MDGVADAGLGLIRDVFVAANVFADRADAHLDAFDVSLRATRPRMRTAYGAMFEAHPLAEALDEPPDHLIVPGFGVVTAGAVLNAVASTDAVPLVRELHERGAAPSAACSGTFVLAESRLLDERPATTSWWPVFRERYPTVALDESRALVSAGEITTAGAALAHIDLSLASVPQVSPALAEAVSDYPAVGDRPRQSDFLRPSLLPITDPVLAAFDRAVRERLDEPVEIGHMADELKVSKRTLQRLTSAHLGLTPIRYVQQVRLERAVDLLRTTDLTVAAIATAVGYQDATTLSTLIRHRRGSAAEQIRRRRLAAT